MTIKYIKLIRPNHWIKNALIFLPLITSHNLFNEGLLKRVSIGAIMFCLLSSAVYVLNDIADADCDRLHPTKRNRPIASGTVTPKAAKLLLAALLGIVALAGIVTFGCNMEAWMLLVLYLGLNIAYSARLKHIALADIFTLASGYPLRVYFCSAITGIEISNWLLLTITSAALFMSLGKRFGEMRKMDSGGQTRKALEAYTKNFLEKTMYMCEAVSVVFYSLWSIDSAKAGHGITGDIVFTVPLVLAIFMRYNLLIERGSDGDPMATLMGDKPLLVIGCVFAVALVVLLYAHK